MSDVVRRVVIGAALACAATTVEAMETLRFTGTARDLKSDRVVYTEAYEVQVDNGRWVAGTTRYFAPDGAAIGERKFDFSKDRYVPLFALDQTNTGYREGIPRIDRGKVDVYAVRDGDRTQASLERVANMVADCGSQPFLVDHLDHLESGKVLKFTLAVPSRGDSFKLRATKAGDVDVAGKRAMRVRIELDSVLRLVLPKLELVIDPASKRMVEYTGVTNLKDPATKKAYSARIVFSYPGQGGR